MKKPKITRFVSKVQEAVYVDMDHKQTIKFIIRGDGASYYNTKVEEDCDDKLIEEYMEYLKDQLAICKKFLKKKGNKDETI